MDVDQEESASAIMWPRWMNPIIEADAALFAAGGKGGYAAQKSADHQGVSSNVTGPSFILLSNDAEGSCGKYSTLLSSGDSEGDHGILQGGLCWY